MKFISFIKDAISADSSTSSKRICGMAGWIVCLLITIYSVIAKQDSPNTVDMLFITSTSLLGLDSVMSIFKSKK